MSPKPPSSPPQLADLNALPRLADPVPSPHHAVELDHLTVEYTQALIDIRSRLPKELRTPQVGIVCGSGLQGLAELLQDRVEVDYAHIHGFGESTVRGHQSSLAFGYLGNSRVPVVCQLGRFHAYEGFKLEQVVYPMRIMKLLGIQVAIITNAAGGLNPQMEVGTIIALQDHISLPSLTSMNPLIGRNRDALGPRFPPMSDAYDFELRKTAFRAAKTLGFKKGTLKEGIYAWVAGPTYETRAEQRFLRAAGADVVGMSTIPEVIAARHAGVRVLVLSLVTNIVVNDAYRSAEAEVEAESSSTGVVKPDGGSEGTEQVVASHQEDTDSKDVLRFRLQVLDVSSKRADDIRALVENIIDGLVL
ncbi:BQ2448_7476 [Microbotryum intermedium]|uniref:purine-nucleoside phosphorylase n=1 Tax=Microbotryum intermedium TaxID=269621 RepID=A0A238FID8_9BASI|nr:BQ2448_7476 [Microbotryum intermedium]